MILLSFPFCKVYAAGECNNLGNKTVSVQYGDDIVFILNLTSYIDNPNSSLSQQSISPNDIQRIRLYADQEEGNERYISSIAVGTRTGKVYARIRYFQGGGVRLSFLFNIGNPGRSIRFNATADYNLTNRVMFVMIDESWTRPNI